MKNKLNFYTKLISTILDSCCTYVILIENLDFKLISFYGTKPFDLDTLKLIVKNFNPTKKSFSLIDIKEFKNTIENENFDSKYLNSIGYLPILDENKITIGYLITSFIKPVNFSKSQEKTIRLISNKISEKLQKNKSITTKDLNSSELTDSKLNLTKEILKKTFKFSNDVFCIVNKEQKFEFVSNASFNVWGFTPEEMIGNPFENYIVEEDVLNTLKIDQQVRNNTEISLFENRYLHKNGAIKNMLWSANWDEESELLYCIAKDVTDFKEIIKKSDENKNLLIEAQQLAKMGSWNYDIKEDKLTWSDGLYNVFDINKELFLETHGSFLDFIIPEDRDFAIQTSKNTQETGEPFNIVYRIKTPSGEQRFVEEFGYSEKDASGKIIRLFGTAQDITERNKNELLLQDSNNKYKYLFENNPLPLFIWDFETLEIVDCNIESLMLYGYTREEFLQLTIKDIRPKEDIDLIVKVTENETIYGEIHKKGWRHLKKNGELMYVDITAHLLDYNNRRCSLVLVKDITENIELEKKQKEHVQFIETTLENLPIGIAVNKIDDGSATLMNSKFYEIYGWPKEDLIDVATFFEKVYPDEEYREKIANQVISDILSKDPERMNWEGITITTQNGTKRIINAKNIPIYDQNLMISTVVDVTEKFTIQKKLLQSNERYNYVTKATSDAIWDWDYINNIIYRAEGFNTIFGFDMKELNSPNTNWNEYIHSDDRIEAYKSILDTIKSDEKYWKHEYRIIKPNGQEAYVHDSAYLIRDENNKVTRIIGALQDVTTRKNEELQNELIADISTVFSEPLQLHETLDRTLRYITNFGDFCFAEAWLASIDQNILKKISSHAATENSRLFIEETNSINTFIYGEGFPGIVSKSKEITIWGDLANQKQFLRRDAALKYGLKTIIGLPLLYNNEVIGVLSFGLDHEVIDTSKYHNLFKKLGDYLSPEIKRKQLELELNQMFNFAPDLIVIIGLDGSFKKVNPAVSQLLGYTQEEMCVEPYVNFIHPEDREKSTNEITKLLKTNLADYFENRYITKSGKIKWLAWNAIYVPEDNNIYAVAKDITDNKELEELLQKVNELAKIGGWEMDLQNNTLFWSDITKEIVEVSPDFIPGIEMAIAFYKNDSYRTKITEYVQQARNTGKSWDDEFEIVTAKGNNRWIRVMGEAEFVNGNCIRIYGSMQDIDERKKAEEELRNAIVKAQESDARFKAYTQQSPIAIYTTDINGDCIYANETWLEMAAMQLEDALGKGWINALHPEDLEYVTDNWYKSIESKGEWNYEYRFLNSNKKIIWVNGSAKKLFNDKNEHIGYLGSNVNITERKKAEEELRNTEERRKLIMNAALDAIICIDKDGIITFWNPQAEQIFGWSENEVMGKVLSTIIIPEHLKSMHDNEMKNYLKTGKGKALNVLLELSAIRRNGTEFPIELTVLPILQDGEEFLCAFIRDITERKTHEGQLLKLNKDLIKQKEELITSNKELEQFAYVASHDLQEPLRMVTSFLTLLEKRYNDVLDEKGLKYINFAVDGAKNMRQIILDILEFSRINNNNNNHEENYEFIDLKDIIKDVSLLQGKLINEKKAKIIFEELPKVYSIRHYLMQLFQNIISNALKYSKEDVPLVIIINSEEHNNYYQIAIKDNGIGIEEEYFEKIFIIFQRLHGKEKYQGNGMGLAIVKKIVDKLNGKIWVESQAGIGSTFYINIPKK